jgi:hypothetical protein
MTRLFLYVHAGGRCEFDGCNDYLLEHHVTKTDGNFAEMAHIFAFSGGGPRAKERKGSDIHALSNLMLLCPKCHKEIDENPAKWTGSVLRRFKRAHEDRVFMLTGTSPDRDTTAVVLRGRVAGKLVTISTAEMQAAVAPRYVSAREACQIDLSQLPDSNDPEYWHQGSKVIRLKMQRCYEYQADAHPLRHVSVFALAPIPLLMVLGACLSDKVPTDLYQRHRDSESWRWKQTGAVVNFATTRLRMGTDAARVALLVAVSGVIAEQDLPTSIDDTYTVYQIAPSTAAPGTGVLQVADSLRAFGSEYRQAIRGIVAAHPGANALDVFPAVPAPVAVAMGRDLLPKRDPVLVVYDFNKSLGGFARTLEINQP